MVDELPWLEDHLCEKKREEAWFGHWSKGFSIILNL